MKVYLHFTSFFHTEMFQDVEICMLYTVYIMSAEALAMHGARASTTGVIREYSGFSTTKDNSLTAGGTLLTYGEMAPDILCSVKNMSWRTCVVVKQIQSNPIS